MAVAEDWPAFAVKLVSVQSMFGEEGSRKEEKILKTHRAVLSRERS